MKYLKRKIVISTLVGCMLSTFVSSAHENQLTEEEKTSGWQLLFDGKSMSQWRNFKKDSVNEKWKVEDDAMVLSAGGGGDIMTRKSYKNFKLKLEWKISEGGNSGIFVLADELGGQIYSHAPEVQILDNENHPDNKIDSHLSGSIFDLIASHSSSHRPAGQWNQVTIKLDDSLLQVWQNGVATASIVLGSSTWNTLVDNSKFATWNGFGKSRSGHIGLQDHGDKVWFRNLKIKELNP